MSRGGGNSGFRSQLTPTGRQLSGRIAQPPCQMPFILAMNQGPFVHRERERQHTYVSHVG